MNLPFYEEDKPMNKRELWVTKVNGIRCVVKATFEQMESRFNKTGIDYQLLDPVKYEVICE